MRLPSCLFIFGIMMLGMVDQAFAAENRLTEKQKIEALITGIERLESATFVRNGSDYNAKTAARFLRGKWSRDEKEISTARTFVERIATKSSTTGKPYIIRFKDGREIMCAAHLESELKKLE